MTACNNNPEANMEYSCTYSKKYYDYNGTCIIDTDADLVCNEIELKGYTDLFNYNAYTADNDVTCVYDEAISDVIVLKSSYLAEQFPNPYWY